MKTCLQIALLSVLFGTVAPIAEVSAQDRTALPKVFDDQDTWPVTNPGDRTLAAERLLGLRLVHKRAFGVHRDDPNVQDVVYRFEEVAWRGKPAILMMWHRSGDLRFDNQSAFIIASISDLKTMRVWDETSSNQGEVQKTYVEDDVITTVTRSGDTDATTIRLSKSPTGFSQMMPYVLLGLMGDLEVGQKYRMPTIDSSTGEVVFNAYHIARKLTIKDAAGKPVEAFEAQTVLNREPAILGHFYVTEDVPFFVGFEMEFLSTGKIVGRHDLKSFEYRR